MGQETSLLGRLGGFGGRVTLVGGPHEIFGQEGHARGKGGVFVAARKEKKGRFVVGG